MSSDILPQAGDESMLTALLSAELAGLLALRDNLPTPNGACSICGDASKGFKISSIIGEQDEKRFESFKKAGYLPDSFVKLDDIENLLCTCPSCAELFDHPTPTVIVIPRNLEFFILWEHRDYERRTLETVSGLPASARTVPEHDDYDRKCRLYVLTDDPGALPEKLRRRIEEGKTEVYTEASPTALILHAGRAMGVPMIYPRGYGLSPAVRQKLLDLFDLWERHSPGDEYSPVSSGGAASFLAGFGRVTSTPPAKKTGKRERSWSSSGHGGGGGGGSGNTSVKSTTRTPKSKRVKMKELTKGDDKDRKKAKMKGIEYTSPASPERWQSSLRRSRVSLSGPCRPLVFDRGEKAARKTTSSNFNKERNGRLKAKEAEKYQDGTEEKEDEDEDEDEGEDEENSQDDGSDEYNQYSDEDEDWEFGPKMSSSDIINSMAKRTVR